MLLKVTSETQQVVMMSGDSELEGITDELTETRKKLAACPVVLTAFQNFLLPQSFPPILKEMSNDALKLHSTTDCSANSGMPIKSENNTTCLFTHESQN